VIYDGGDEKEVQHHEEGLLEHDQHDVESVLSSLDR